MRSSLLQIVLVSFLLAGIGCGAPDLPPPPPPPPPGDGDPSRGNLLVASDGPPDEKAQKAQMVAAPASAERATGRVAFYRFDEIDGPVLDSSGNELHGAATDVVRGEKGRFGRAAFFNGMSFVRVPASKHLDFTDAATIEVWMKIATREELAGRGIGFVSDVGNPMVRGTGANDDNVIFSTSCGNLQAIFSRAGGPTTNATTACGLVPAGQWVHVAMVNDGKELRLYLDGALVKVDKGGVMGPIASDLYIGQRQQQIFGFQGMLDELQWWRVARTQPQICGDAGGTWNGKICVWPR